MSTKPKTTFVQYSSQEKLVEMRKSLKKDLEEAKKRDSLAYKIANILKSKKSKLS